MSAERISERPLPHSVDAERAILSAILLDGPGTNGVLDELEPVDFFVPQHQTIFRHMRALRDKGVPTNDYVLLQDSLEVTNELESAGGIAYITAIPDGSPRISNLTHHLGIVKSKAQLRRYAHKAHDILEKALGANANPSDLLRELSEISVHLREEVGRNRILKFRSGADITMATDQQIQWILPGFVVRGGITELGAKVKAGKTTLLMSLVRSALDGVAFLSRPTLKTPAVYLTEQPAASFRQAMERAGLLGRDDFHFLLHSDTRRLPWAEVAAAAVKECERVGAALLVVDTLPHFAGLKGDSENNSGDALTAMAPLLEAAANGIGVILTRHERKSGGEVGDSGRGSSAFAGAVDIVLSLRKPGGNSKNTQRVLQALSRFSDTPAKLLVELTETSYVALGEPQDETLGEAKDSIVAAVPEPEVEALTLKEITASSGVPRSTAQRAIDELVQDGALSKVGSGKRNNPFRYFKTENRLSPTSTVGGQKETVERNPD